MLVFGSFRERKWAPTSGLAPPHWTVRCLGRKLPGFGSAHMSASQRRGTRPPTSHWSGRGARRRSKRLGARLHAPVEDLIRDGRDERHDGRVLSHAVDASQLDALLLEA